MPDLSWRKLGGVIFLRDWTKELYVGFYNRNNMGVLMSEGGKGDDYEFLGMFEY
jgi:hypothetical protein